MLQKENAMNEDSPFFIYDPESRGSLFFKYDLKRPIKKTDIN